MEYCRINGVGFGNGTNNPTYKFHNVGTCMLDGVTTFTTLLNGVSPTVFNHLINVSSDIQTQINNITVSSINLSGNNNWTGTNTYKTNLPTSTKTPTNNIDLITKIYGDSTYPKLLSDNTFSGINTGNISIPSGKTINLIGNINANGTTITATQIATLLNNTKNINTEFNKIVKISQTSNYTQFQDDVRITNNLNVLGNNMYCVYGTFSKNITVTDDIYCGKNFVSGTTTLTPTEISYLDNLTSNVQIQINNIVSSQISLSGNNTWTGFNSYNTNLPTSTKTPTNNTELITKIYGDSTYPRLLTNNTFSGINTGNISIPAGKTINLVGNIIANSTTITDNQIKTLENNTKNIKIELDKITDISYNSGTSTTTIDNNLKVNNYITCHGIDAGNTGLISYGKRTINQNMVTHPTALMVCSVYAPQRYTNTITIKCPISIELTSLSNVASSFSFHITSLNTTVLKNGVFYLPLTTTIDKGTFPFPTDSFNKSLSASSTAIWCWGTLTNTFNIIVDDIDATYTVNHTFNVTTSNCDVKNITANTNINTTTYTNCTRSSGSVATYQKPSYSELYDNYPNSTNGIIETNDIICNGNSNLIKCQLVRNNGVHVNITKSIPNYYNFYNNGGPGIIDVGTNPVYSHDDCDIAYVIYPDYRLQVWDTVNYTSLLGLDYTNNTQYPQCIFTIYPNWGSSCKLWYKNKLIV